MGEENEKQVFFNVWRKKERFGKLSEFLLLK